MAEPIRISLPDIYEPITEEMIADAKQWTLRRNENALYLSGLIDALLQDAIKDMTQIAYKYNCKPEEWQFSQNKKLREEVANIMDDLEDEIMGLVVDYSLNESKDEKRRSTLLPWLLALRSKGTTDLQSTLHARLTQFLFDTEAQIAAMKLLRYDQTNAITRAISTMHSVYTAPELLAAFKMKSAAMYIQSKGVHEDNRGLSSSGANNVDNFGQQTATIGWMKSQLMQFQEDGAVGYYQLRGSSFLCAICDDETGLHIGDIINDPFPHAHCVCYRVPVSLKDEIVQNNVNERQKEYERLEDDENYEDVEFNPKNGGLKATHIGHNFDKRGGVYEKHVQNAGFKAGNAVILENERGGAFSSKFTEGTWNGKKFEVAGRETATENNILRGLKHCASKGDTKIAVLDYPNGGFNLQTLNNAMKRYRGLEKLNDGQYVKFNEVICVQNEKIVYDKKF